MAEDTWTKTENRMTQLKPMHTRMGETEDLAYMMDYHLMAWDGKTKLEKVVNVTGNKGSSHLHRIISSLISQTRQVVVEGDISKRASHKVEKFLEYINDQTDIYLAETQGIPDLHTYLCNHVCVRGPIGVEWMSWLEENEYKIHCFPLDMRWTPFVHNKWVAPITFSTRDDLEVELEKYEKRAKDKSIGEYTKFGFSKELEIEVRDYWDLKNHELWIEKQLVYKEPNTLGDLPFVIVFPPVGFMLRSKGYMEHEGEDALFLIRKLNKELNRTLSVDATFAFRQLYPAYEYETKNFDAKPARAAPKTGEGKKVPEGELHQMLPTGDMNTASRFTRTDTMAMMDEGTPSAPRAYTQPPSAVEVATEIELQNQLQQARVVAMQMLWSQLYMKQITQFQKITQGYGGELTIGKRGKRKSFSGLEDPEKYSVDCQFMSKNKRLEIVNEARYLALYGRSPLEYIVRDVLMVEDVDGWMRAMELEEAKRANPALALLEMAIRYVEEAQDMEDEDDKDAKILQSKILLHDYVMQMRMRLQPPQPGEGTEIKEQTGNANALISMLGPGGMGGEVLGGKTPQEVKE